MNIDELTIKQARELAELFRAGAPAQTKTFFKVGSPYLIRTVTMIQVGRITDISDNEIMLEDASWVADTGRFYDALANGSLKEIEPFPNGCIVNRGSIVDASPWLHVLPDKQK